MIKKILKIKLKILRILLLASLILLISAYSERAHERFLYEYKGSSVVKLMPLFGDGSGTGFQIISSSGKQFTMTNRHVCDGLKNRNMGIDDVQWQDVEGNKGIIKIIYRDEKADLCLLEGIKSLRALKPAKSFKLKEKIALIGHPGGRGLSYETGFFVEKKDITISSYCYKNIKKFCYIKYKTNHINTIAYPGNSGSPVLDFFGNVVGVLFAGSNVYLTASFIVTFEDVERVLSKH